MKLFQRPMFLAMSICCAASFLSFYLSEFIPLFAVFAAAVILFFVLFLEADFRITVAVVAVLLVFYSAFSATKTASRIESLSGEKFTAELTVTEEPEVHGKVFIATVKADTDGKLKDGVKLSAMFYTDISLQMGERIKAKIELGGLENTQYLKYNYAEGIYGSCRILSVEERVGYDRLLSLTNSIHKYTTQTLFRNLSYNCAVTVNALVTGDTSAFSETFKNEVRNSGVSHVMVVSGMHLAIIMGAVQSLLSVLGNNRFVKTAVSVFTVLFISAVCGFTMSIMRAGIMFIVSAFAGLFRRDSDSLSSLGVAIIIILIQTPFALFSVSLQLSSLATFGILVISPQLTELIKLLFRLKSRIIISTVGLVCTTVSATVMTLPVSIHYFSSISFTTLLTNLLINHAVTAALTIAVISLVLCRLPVISVMGEVMFVVCELLVRYINMIISHLGFSGAAAEVEDWAAFPMALVVFMILYVIDTCKNKGFLLKLKKEIG